MLRTQWGWYLGVRGPGGFGCMWGQWAQWIPPPRSSCDCWGGVGGLDRLALGQTCLLPPPGTKQARLLLPGPGPCCSVPGFFLQVTSPGLAAGE